MRVRFSRRSLGLRKDHLAVDDGRPRPADIGSCVRSRPAAGRALGQRPCRLQASAREHHLPIVQPRAIDVRRGQRRAAADSGRSRAGGEAPPSPSSSRAGRPGGACKDACEPSVWRRAAEGRRRAGAGQPAWPHPRRRTNRKPRLGGRRGHLEAAHRPQPARSDGGPGHARPRGRSPCPARRENDRRPRHRARSRKANRPQAGPSYSACAPPLA